MYYIILFYEDFIIFMESTLKIRPATGRGSKVGLAPGQTYFKCVVMAADRGSFDTFNHQLKFHTRDLQTANGYRTAIIVSALSVTWAELNV